MPNEPTHPEPPRANPSERACPTCRHVLWAVALGLGVRCRHPANNPGDVERVLDHFAIPNRHYVCPHYEPRRSRMKLTPELTA